MRRVSPQTYRLRLSRDSGPIVFALMLRGCAACRVVREELARLEKEFPQVDFTEAEASEDPTLAVELDADKPPLVQLLCGGRVRFTSSGLVERFRERLRAEILSATEGNH